MAVSASASARSSPRPAASATSNQRRTPYDVVASSTSGRAAMIARCRRRPRLVVCVRDPERGGVHDLGLRGVRSAAMRSSDRRSDVTPIRKPVELIGAESGRGGLASVVRHSRARAVAAREQLRGRGLEPFADAIPGARPRRSRRRRGMHARRGRRRARPRRGRSPSCAGSARSRARLSRRACPAASVAARARA